MEYSRDGALPRVSWVDAGTVEMVRGLGVEVVSSADTVQYATQRWSEDDLRSHRAAAGKLDAIVSGRLPVYRRTAQVSSDRVRGGGVHSVAIPGRGDGSAGRPDRGGERARGRPALRPDSGQLACHRFGRLGAHRPVGRGWRARRTCTRTSRGRGTSATTVPSEHREVFEVVVGARDAAVAAIAEHFEQGRRPQGWEIDKVARDYIGDAGYGEYFSHRLGHSIGREVHGNAVNLDSWETHDTRRLIPGIVTSVEPGIYLPGKFGVRSEIDVYISEEGLIVTTAVQRERVMIGR